MSLVTVIVVVLLAGLAVWAINQADFINATFKKIAYVIIVVAMILWLLSVFGMLPAGMPRVR